MSDDDDWFEKERIHSASELGQLDKVKALVESGYDVNACDELLFFTPLHYAAREGHLDIMEYLISVGADVNAHNVDNIGETPLGEVAANCSYDVAKKLIDAGANPTIEGSMQITALQRASERKHLDGIRVYKLLLETAKKKFNYDA